MDTEFRRTADPDAPARTIGAGRLVVVIEDDTHIAEAIRYLLAREGWRVTALAEGLGAAQLIRDHCPALVVLDLMLPDCSGIEVLADLATTPPACPVPVLVLSARGQVADRDAAFAAGAVAVMAKPFANTDLIAEIARLARPGAQTAGADVSGAEVAAPGPQP